MLNIDATDFWFISSLTLFLALLGLVGGVFVSHLRKAREDALMRSEIRDWEIAGNKEETLSFEGILLARNETSLKGLWREYSLYRMTDGRHLVAWEVTGQARHETAGYRIIEHGENVIERTMATLKWSDQTNGLLTEYRQRLQERATAGSDVAALLTA